ncbi:MAG: serine protease [Treponema sp.]|nr:serine protease [Treponema sp.]
MKKSASMHNRRNDRSVKSSGCGRVPLFRCIAFLAMISGGAVFCFGQAESLRDYVGLINQSFHPDIVSYLGKFRTEFERRGNTDAARSIDSYLKGGSGTGFVYVAPDGANYIITNHHVITQAYDISVTFEKQDGLKVKYEGLTIIAADEDMDIALLSFPRGGRPFTGGLAFLDRPVNEGEDVYSAGFPTLGNTTMWQFGRGMVSNAHVEFPEDDYDEKSRIMGPYIQHTAQVDPGNSGGPLLVQAPDLPTGYAVAGINTLSARFRQAANFSIPTDRVQTFLDSTLNPRPEDERRRLDARLNSFIEGLTVPRAVYEHIAKYLSNACTAENAEYALTEMLRNANRTVQDNIIRAFIYSPVEGMGYAVAWTIENALRTQTGRIAISVDSVAPANENSYTVNFKVNNGTISSLWVNDYGIWRINSFGDFAAGDKTLIERRNRTDTDARRLRTDYDFHLSAGFAYLLEAGPAFGGDIKYHSGFAAYGFRAYIAGKDFFQGEFTTGFYIPIRIKKIGLIPYGNFGMGLVVKEPDPTTPDSWSLYEDPIGKDIGINFSLEGGLLFTTSLIPGLFLQASYQHNFYTGTIRGIKPGILFFGIGYGF